MSDKLTKLKPKARLGRPPIHAAFSLVAQDKILAEHPYLRRYLELRYNEIVRDVAGSEDGLSGPQKVLIDSLLSRIKKRLVLEIYFERYGLFEERRLERKILEGQPILKFYLSLCAGIDRGLALLGLNKRQEKVVDLADYIEQKYGKGKAKDGQPEEGDKRR
jgi:hypothetical protein